MSFFGLPVFKVPSALIGRHSLPVIPANPVIYVPHVSVQKYVGCIIITDSLSGYGYDILLPKLSGKNAYGVFSGQVNGRPCSDFDCANTLMRSIHFVVNNAAQFIEFTDPATGNPYKIFVMHMRRIDLPRMNANLRGSIASNDFPYFTRFPLNLISQFHNYQCLRDDAGIDHFLDSTAVALVSRLVPNIHRYV